MNEELIVWKLYWNGMLSLQHPFEYIKLVGESLRGRLYIISLAHAAGRDVRLLGLRRECMTGGMRSMWWTPKN